MSTELLAELSIEDDERKLPPYSSAPVPLLGNTLEFKSSPASFIDANEDIFTANIINKNVVITRNYNTIVKVLESESISSSEPYQEYMGKSLPEPNILLQQPTESMNQLKSQLKQIFEKVDHVDDCVEKVLGSAVGKWRFSTKGHDLYNIMKELSQDLVHGCILGIYRNDGKHAKQFDSIVKHNEDIFRGQISVPVQVNSFFFKSPLSKGIEARKRLIKIFKSEEIKNEIPFNNNNNNNNNTSDDDDDEHKNADTIDEETFASHLVLFSGSIVVKSLASLLCSLLLEMYNPNGNRPLNKESTVQEKENFIKEVERLHAPVIGCPRRTTRNNEPIGEYKIPKGWDIWLYLLGGNTDESVYGNDAKQFCPARWTASTSPLPEPLTFGYGRRSCIGKKLVRKMLCCIVDKFIEMNVDMTVHSSESDTNVDYTCEIEGADKKKLLPVNRPKKPVFVRFSLQ